MVSQVLAPRVDIEPSVDQHFTTITKLSPTAPMPHIASCYYKPWIGMNLWFWGWLLIGNGMRILRCFILVFSQPPTLPLYPQVGGSTHTCTSSQKKDETPIVMVQAHTPGIPKSLPIGVDEPRCKKAYRCTAAFCQCKDREIQEYKQLLAAATETPSSRAWSRLRVNRRPDQYWAISSLCRQLRVDTYILSHQPRLPFHHLHSTPKP